MRLLTLLFAVLGLMASPDKYDELMRQAELEYAQKSFARAQAIYAEAAKLALEDSQRRWVAMRLADTRWRAKPGDFEEVEAGRKALQELIDKAPEARDRVHAEAAESIGDLYSTRYDYGTGAQYYAMALDWWAGQQDLETARERYLAIVRRSARDGYLYSVSVETLVNALQIAKSDEERAWARLNLARRLLLDRTAANTERAIEHLQAVIDGPRTEWTSHALFDLATQLSQTGDVIVFDNGVAGFRPDHQRALVLFRRLVDEYPEGKAARRNDAIAAIKTITSPEVAVSVDGTYLPGVEQTIRLGWRNLKAIDLQLVAVDLSKDVDPKSQSSWPRNIRLDSGRVVRKWTVTTSERQPHERGVETVRITPRLERGAYVVVASGGGRMDLALLLVSDATVVVHMTPRAAVVQLADVLTGEPIANASVQISRPNVDGKVRVSKATTGADGVARVPIDSVYGQLLVTAARGDRQAYHLTYGWDDSSPDSARWRIYAFTDRPAYRPNETVQWKIFARTGNDDAWKTPAGETLAYEINGPRGDSVARGDLKLDEFGGASASLALTPSMALGGYSIIFQRGERRDEGVGYAELFRLEEYKLPEYRVSVTTNDEHNRPRVYRLGETIEATLDAQYYFGGPVANATVEVVVSRSTYQRYWTPYREYDWYFERGRPSWSPPPQVLRRETLTTDANGRATVRIETSRDAGDALFTIEARVVDASRREVRGSGTVRVMKQRYSVFANARHRLHRPGDPVAIDFDAIDANDQPVQTTGRVKVIRREWRDKQYETEEVLSSEVRTDARGRGTLTFTAKREGWYSVEWSSDDAEAGRRPRAFEIVTASTNFWVAERNTRYIGYRSSGLELIVDRESIRAGERVPLLVLTPEPGRWLLLTTTSSEILDAKALKLDGTAKMLELETDDRHVPLFRISASTVFDRQLAFASADVVVPPVAHFLDVEVKADREEVEPGQEGTVTVTTRDASGKPVSAQVALAVFDESVSAIASDPAGDPRQFFFDRRDPVQLTVGASVQSQRYLSAKDVEVPKPEEGRQEQADGVVGGVVGGSGAEMDMAKSRGVTAPSPVPPPPPMAVAESLTVAAQAANEVTTSQTMSNSPVEVTVDVRSDFRSTAFWQPDLVTAADGTASVKVKYPQALTTWRATARAATGGAEFGIGSTSARTKLPLIVRLQAPRFFVAGDRVVVSAVINNNTDAAMRVTPSIETEGVTLASPATAAAVDVAANGETRVDWTVVAERAGVAKLRVTGRGPARGDAMERSFVVYEHGIDKLLARSGRMRSAEAIVKIELPRARRASELTVQVQPSIAAAMFDALPYLLDYPYGCTEQTMSRFLPAAIVAKTGKKVARLDEITTASMARLYDFQHHDGAWGWWKEGESDRFMTAYVIWGFSIAKQAGLKVDDEALNRAARWLDARLIEAQDDPHLQAWMLHALSAWREATKGKPTANESAAFDNVWKERQRLTPYSRALLALAAHRYGNVERERILVRNLEDGVTIDRTPDRSVLLRDADGTSPAETMATAYWGAAPGRFWWRWYEGPVETTAFVLQALATIEPKHKLVEPAMNWLVKNRRGSSWNNTRDTAIAILALSDYLKATGELDAKTTFEVSVNGQLVCKGCPKAAVDPKLLQDGANEIRIRRTSGSGSLYFSAKARFVSLEEPVTAAGNELFVKREYFRLVPKPTLLKGVVYEREPLPDGGSVKSGERIEVVVTIETKNDYEYLLFEDLKPAGFEAVELQSGQQLWATSAKNEQAFVYQELRDRKVALFADRLGQGIWTLRYPLRAEVPGTFHALPLLGEAMYVPGIQANGDEVRVEVRD